MKRFQIVLILIAALAMRAFGEEHEHKHEEHGQDEHHHADEVKLTAEAIARHGIKVEPVKAQTLSPRVMAPARVSFNSEAMAHVGVAVKGRIVEMKARVGDVVKKDDVLLIVESPELGEAQSDFLQKKTTVEVAQSAIDPAKSAAERGKKLHEQSQGISLSEVEKRGAELKSAQGALKSGQSALAAAEAKLRLMGMNATAIAALAKSGEIDPLFTVRAPLSGHVIEREVTLGELVSPEKDALLVLANLDTLWVLADIPEVQIKHISIGAKARVRIEASDVEAIDGKVALISPTIDASTRTASVRIEVAGAASLRPGMFASAEIVARSPTTVPSVIAVPEQAVQIVEGGPAVFVPVEGEENTFAKRAVTVGKAVGDMVPVLDGLKEGESIVVHGSFILKAELGKGEAEHHH